ncbi:MAG: FAD-dependent monooxygenase [Gammaproteobacteria bacterium]|nr:FAD-dependent monooxygenase [Gammaproteobacteria bacterium]
MTGEDSGVVIVGAGPVGLSAALFLVARDVPVTVLEAEASLSEDMRASTFHPPTLDMLQEFGISSALLEMGHVATKWQYRHHDTGERIVFDLSVLSDLTTHPFRLQCEQFRLTRAIVELLTDNPLFRIQFDSEVQCVRQDGSSVTVDVASAAGLSSIRGQYLVAADGGRSAVRELLQLPFRGETYPMTSITLVVDFPFEQYFSDMLFVNYLWTSDDHFSLMRVRDFWRTGFSPKPGQSLADALSSENVEQHLQRILPRPRRYRVVHKAAYSVHRRVLDRFDHGRIMFAGDAAHLNSPSGGMGMNSGVHDAYELAASLASVLMGDGDVSCLERYSRRRRAVAVEEVQKTSDANYRRHREKDPEKRRHIWERLKATSENREELRSFLRKTSMIDSLEMAASIS